MCKKLRMNSTDWELMKKRNKLLTDKLNN
jgi:hypothetical protein